MRSASPTASSGACGTSIFSNGSTMWNRSGPGRQNSLSNARIEPRRWVCAWSANRDFRPSHGGTLPLPGGAHQSHRQDDHSVASVLHFRGRDAVSAAIYADMEDFYRDLGQTYRGWCARSPTPAAVTCSWTKSIWPICAIRRAAADDARSRRRPGALPAVYADMINAAIADGPSDMRITMHLCRGNFRSSWIAQGGYEPVAKLLFHGSAWTAISWNSTPNAPAASSRCDSCRRARCGPRRGDFQDRRAGERSTICSGESIRRPSSWISSSFASRRSAGSPAPKRAIH